MDDSAAKRLREPFPQSAIGKLPKAGVMLDYVGHAATTDRLLEVDPDWTWEPFALDEKGLPALDERGNLWIKLTVCGVTRPGVGDGKNAKELIGDAIRNAAMRFGVALDLWAKEDLHANGDVESASLMERQKQRIQARVIDQPDEDIPFGDQSQDDPPTVKERKKLDVLIATLRKSGHITTQQIYSALAKSRNIDIDTMAELVSGRDETGELHWGPLRGTLTKVEAEDLIGRLENLEKNVKAIGEQT